MKRGAERQIQREDGDDPHGVGSENDGSTISGGDRGGQGNADISARPIRGLPKKKVGGNSFGGSASPSPAATASSPFGSFGSFTSTNTTSLNTNTAPKPTFSFGQPSNGFGANSSNTTTSLSASAKPFTFSAPATASGTASNGISSAAPLTSTSASEKDLEYYRALRGINESLKQQLGNSIEAALRKDAFADLSGLLQNIRTKYEAFRAKAESKRGSEEKGVSTSGQEPAKVLYPDGIAQLPPGSTPDNTKNPFIFTANSSTSQPLTEPKTTTNPPAQPSVSLPKPPASGGFSFAGSSFSGPSSSSSVTSDAKLLPGQPTFALPKSGFFKTFGKESDEEQEGENEEDNEKEADNKKQKDESASTNDASKPTSTGFSFPSLSSSNPTSLGAPTTTTNGSSGTKPFQFSFGGNAAAAAKPSAGATSAFGAPSLASTAPASASPAPTFSFGGDAAAAAAKPSAGATSAFVAPSLASTAPASASPAPTFSFGQSSGSKTPSIGSNFANTSGVTQPGAFSFGSGKISFGSPSPSTGTNGGTGSFGNGNASSATTSFGSTGFTFGSRLSGTEKNDESENKEDSKSS